MIFCSHESLASAIDFYADIKQRAAAFGRDPDQVKILPAATLVVGTDVRDAMAKHEPSPSWSRSRRDCPGWPTT